MSKSWQTISNNRLKCPPSATVGELNAMCGIVVTEQATLNGDLVVVGNATFKNDVTVEGDITIEGDETLNGVLYLNAGTVQGDPDVENSNKTNTYIRFGEAGSTNDWAYLRQIGGVDEMNISLDMFDNANDGRFTIRGIEPDYGNPDKITNILNISRNNIAMGSNAGQSSQSNGAIAIGNEAGQINQGLSAVAVGLGAGNTNQGIYAVAVGAGAGNNAQGANAVAIGFITGQNNQGANAVAIGNSAGYSEQNSFAVAIGYESGKTIQGPGSVAIGYRAGQTGQQNISVAIGYEAGQINQGDYAIAIGTGAGKNNQSDNSIILNASGSALNCSTNGFYVKPIRNITGGSNLLHYNSVNGEITYETGGAGAYLPLTGGTLTGNLNLTSTLQLNSSYGDSGQILTSQGNISTPIWNDIAYRYVIATSPTSYSRTFPSSPSGVLFNLASIDVDSIIPGWASLPNNGIGYIHCVGGTITLAINGGSGADVINIFIRMVTSEALEFDSPAYSFSQRNQSMTFMAPYCFATVNFSKKPIQLVIYCDKHVDDPIQIDWANLKFEIVYYPLNVTKYSITGTFNFPP